MADRFEIRCVDQDHCWINGRQFVSLRRAGEMIKEKHLTNADRIRSMTDEELADLFDTWVRDCDCNDVPCRDYCLPNRYDCVKNWLDWLKQEAGA